MKTEAITESIIKNYKILSEKSTVKSNQDGIKTFWGLNYKPKNKSEGYVNEIGSIQRKNAKIQIRDGEIFRFKKPLFSTWNKALKNINAMLENMISNYENSEVVKKTNVKVLIFPKYFWERVSKIKK